MTKTIHRLFLGAVALSCIVPGCHRDPLPKAGSLVMRQVGGRLGDTADNLGILVVGQSVCGTHVALDAEAGEFTIFGGARRTSACVKPPSDWSPQTIELVVYPTETAALLHARLLIEPRACATLPEDCQHLCVEVPDEKADDTDTDTDTDAIDEGRPVTDACPSGARLLDQATLLVSGVLPEASDGGTGSSGTTTAPDAGTDSAGTTGTTTTGETEAGTTSATATSGSGSTSSTGTTSEDTSSTT